MKIVLTGGGTAGHVMPNIALLPELKKHFSSIHYIGTNGIEKNIISEYDAIKYHEISAVKFIRSLTPKNLLIPYKLFKSVQECREILKKIRPNVVFSKGGFVSVPVVIAAHKLGIPVISHESDKSMGLANKIILRFSKKMCLSFRETSKNRKCIYTGSPIRESIFKGNKIKILQKASFDMKKNTLLFMGGSLGSKAINKAVYDSLPQLTKKYNVVHICGKNNLKNDLDYKNYLQIEYTNTIEDCFALADFVICRSGANTIFELLALNKPMLLIPLSKKQSRGDQIENAKLFESYGYAHILEEEKLNKNNLIIAIDKIVKDKNNLLNDIKKYKAVNSNKKIIDIILSNSK